MALPTQLLSIDAPGQQDIIIAQGSTFLKTFTVSVNGVVIDLGATTTASAQIRDKGGNLLASFVATVSDPSSLGQVTIKLSPSATTGLTPMSPAPIQPALAPTGIWANALVCGYWDVDLTDGTDRVTVLRGLARIALQATIP